VCSAITISIPNKADFRSFPGVPSCCPLYQDGSGSGFTAGLLYELPLADQFRLALRAGYSSRSGTMKRTENTTVAGNIPGIFEHQVDASISDIGIEPLLQYNPFASLWLNLGGRMAFVSTKNFSQKETIVSPANGIFPSGSSRRNVVSDQEIPDGSSLYAAVVGGISYDLPLNVKNTLILAPEVLYSLGITPVVSGLTWSSNSLRVGIALKYSPLPSKEPVQRFDKKQIIDTVRKESVIAVSSVVQGKELFTSTSQEIGDVIVTTETMRRTDTLLVPQKAQTTTPNIPQKQVALSATVSASGVESDGTETATVKLEVEEFASVLMTPLLNYIFFDDNSSTLPSRYKQLDEKGIERFREEKVNNPNRLSTYYQILNIIGKRMRQNPDATVTLIGCNADIGAEKGNLALSKQRAEAVKEYIVSKWNVPESQFKIETRNLPLILKRNYFAILSFKLHNFVL
jgi:outer membrane protein OmpA-like peptidoglycan-associated protein